MFEDVKSQRLATICHHVQHIISSEGPDNVDVSLCARDKAESRCWMLMIFGPSRGAALKTGKMLFWKSLHGLRITSKDKIR